MLNPARVPLAVSTAARNILPVPTVKYLIFQHDFFGDPTKDPWHGSYRGLQAPFVTDHNQPASTITPTAV